MRIVPIAVNTSLYDPETTAPLRLPFTGRRVFGAPRRFWLPDGPPQPPPPPSSKAFDVNSLNSSDPLFRLMQTGRYAEMAEMAQTWRGGGSSLFWESLHRAKPPPPSSPLLPPPPPPGAPPLPSPPGTRARPWLLARMSVLAVISQSFRPVVLHPLHKQQAAGAGRRKQQTTAAGGRQQQQSGLPTQLPPRNVTISEGRRGAATNNHTQVLAASAAAVEGKGRRRLMAEEVPGPPLGVRGIPGRGRKLRAAVHVAVEAAAKQAPTALAMPTAVPGRVKGGDRSIGGTVVAGSRVERSVGRQASSAPLSSEQKPSEPKKGAAPREEGMRSPTTSGTLSGQEGESRSSTMSGIEKLPEAPAGPVVAAPPPAPSVSSALAPTLTPPQAPAATAPPPLPSTRLDAPASPPPSTLLRSSSIPLRGTAATATTLSISVDKAVTTEAVIVQPPGNSKAGGTNTSGTSGTATRHRRRRTRPFVFISTFKWEMRKGWDRLVHAYLEEFSAEDDVELYILTKAFMTGR